MSEFKSKAIGMAHAGLRGESVQVVQTLKGILVCCFLSIRMEALGTSSGGAGIRTSREF